MTRYQRMRWALIIITVIFTALVGAVFGITGDRINDMRGIFCDFAASTSAGFRQLPQAPGRVRIEQSYARLQQRLGC